MQDSWQKTSSTAPVILFATPPPLDTLQAMTVRVDNCANTSFPGIKMQPQVIKCREFIFTEPEIIGTPSLDPKDQCFHIVAQVSLIESGKLQTRLSRVGLQVTKPYPVTPELYQSCLRYTLMARISPNWNKVGEWLVQGREFLTRTGAVNAVKLDLSVNCDELYFTLEATALKVSPLKVTDLDLYGNSMEKFLNHQIIEIDHERIASDWCYVLPSMKRGKIMSICHEIPEESPFMSYRDMKRYWKNTYGFRLPDSDEDMIFYQIHFGPLGGRLFTYPEVCLRARETQKVSRVDPKPILRDFMREVTAKFPTICGAPMKLQSKAKFPLAWLFESGQTDPQTKPNLTNKMSARPTAYRSKDEMERLLSSKPDYLKPDFSTSQMGSKPDFPASHMHLQSRTQSYNLPCSATSNTSYKITNVPSVRLQQGSQQETPARQLGFTQQNSNEHKKEIPVRSISAPNSNRTYTTPARTEKFISGTPINGNKISSCLLNPVKFQDQSVSSTFTSGMIYGSSCQANEETPQHSHVSQNGNKEMEDSSVARKLIYPQFKPKNTSQISNSVNQTVGQQPFKPSFSVQKTKPTFSVQKTSAVSIQRMSNILQVTARSSPAPVSDTDIDRPMAINSPFSTSFTSTMSSQPPQQAVKKIPLFFKKKVDKPVLYKPKPTPTMQKSTGVKKTKSAAANKEGKEKTTKGVKRSMKKDGEVKKKKVKVPNPKLPEQ